MSVSVNSAQSSSYGSTSSDQGSKTGVDYDSFLRLLVAEMKNQDPTNPMDSTQYVAQLAAFSQVEQSVQINNRLDQLLQSSALSQADALIGRTITSADGATTGEVVEVRLTSGGVVAVLDNGKTVDVGAGISITATAADADTAAGDTSGTDETTGAVDTDGSTETDETDADGDSTATSDDGSATTTT